jgi:hypothetical protein
MDYSETLIIVLMLALAGVFYLVYRLYIRPGRRHGKPPGGTKGRFKS